MGKEEQTRETLLEDIFAALDHKKRGFISKVELAHILDAVQADKPEKIAIPEALVPSNIQRDAKVSPKDLGEWLSGMNVLELNDLKWFAESVMKVDSELKEVWAAAVKDWQEHVITLHLRDLHRYLLNTQPERVSRWLLLRTRIGDSAEAHVNLPGLGISCQEVETLFSDDTADEISRCTEHVKPFVSGLQLVEQLRQLCCGNDAAESSTQISDMLAQLCDLASSRDVACLLVHEDALGIATAIVRSHAFSHEVVVKASNLVMTLLSYRINEGAKEYEHFCRQTLSNFLETDFDLSTFDLKANLCELCEAAPRAPSGGIANLQLRCSHSETISDWLAATLTLPQDVERGEMIDLLIKYDEQRLLLVSDGGERQDESFPVPASHFSFGRSVPFILCRLDVSSHHLLHEHRTPMRSHLWKLLLNILSTSGERGRQLFRVGEGMRVVCSVMRGDCWGIERPVISLEEEMDMQEEQELRVSSQSAWESSEPTGSWPRVELFEGGNKEYSYYSMDFVDDKFYGSKDRTLARAFLEYMEEIWGRQALVEEMTQYPNTLQVLCRAKPTPAVLLKVFLNDPLCNEFLERTSSMLAGRLSEQLLNSVAAPDLSRCSFFPFGFAGGVLQQSEDKKDQFKRALCDVEAKNVFLRILAYAYHHIQASQSPEHRDENVPEETSEADIEELCRSLAYQLPVSVDEILDISAAIYVELGAAKRKASLTSSTLQVSGAMGQELTSALRLLQLMQLKEPQLPDFSAEMQALLVQILHGVQEPAPAQDFASPLHVELHQIPLRRSQLCRYPRDSPLDVVVGLESALSDFTSLSPETDTASRKFLTAIVLGHLCYFNADEIFLENSEDGLTSRLGLFAATLTELKELLSDGPLSQLRRSSFADVVQHLPDGCLRQRSPEAAIALLQLTLDEGQTVAFVCIAGTWTLWANNRSLPCITNADDAPAYFGL
eukprot:TRINITY_DN23423_c0_g1_i1.p1 TRINITY_DN23423_c0_g1~~TRINITY_DN23423_c0_g1_i1.p1  ORF type:complete len:949 (+),score=154.27 TRINITY_DN23423_c0_g1_i1:124-2970(+)